MSRLLIVFGIQIFLFFCLSADATASSAEPTILIITDGNEYQTKDSSNGGCSESCCNDQSDELECNESEILDTCPGPCFDDFCPTSDEKDDSCALLDPTPNSCGEPACKCRFNNKRDYRNGNCIPTRDCPPFDCSGRPNEEYNSCPPLCPSDDCSQASPSGRCPFPGRIGIILECRPTCRCIEGYWRKNGICVPYAECPQFCPENEEFSNCTQTLCRPENCTQVNQPVACPSVQEESCQEGCVCVEGTLRAANGTCISKDQCPGLICGENEILNNCTNGCYKDKCSDYSDKDDCVAADVCGPPKCQCIDNYKRDDNGVCIPIENCKSICGENETLNTCPNGCDNDMCPNNINNQPILDCASLDVCLEPKCQCIPNYRRDDSGVCIPIEECPDLICDENETLDKCPSCTNDFCPTSDGEDICAVIGPTESCRPPRCKCTFNYKRSNQNGTCIPTRDCPPFDCSARPNEEYNSCPPLCPRDDCSQATPSGRCPIFGRIGIVLECAPKCRCIQGYWRNNGICVPYADCPGICPENEQFSNCTQAVCRAQNCTEKGQPMVDPSIPEGSCQQGCVCIEGTLRAENGSCIPEVCPSNEEFNECNQVVCRALNCSQRDQPIACTDIVEGPCIRGCICQAGYLRTSNGECVPEDRCYGDLVCDEDETVDTCSRSCTNDFCPTSDDEDTCSTTGLVESCGPPRCKCRFNYKRSNQNGTCIPTRDCPPFDCSARPNEEYNSCPPLCPSDDCSQATPSGRCPIFGRIGIVVECEPKCRCIQGYWRSNGICVPYADCPTPCGNNEIFNECPSVCTNDVCPKNFTNEVEKPCIKICGTSKCQCMPNFSRDVDGACIPTEECPEICPNNEQYSSCSQATCRAQNCSEIGQPIACPRIASGFCKRGCVCIEGTLRANNGSCIPQDQCPEQTCGDNEELNDCSSVCYNDACPENLMTENNNDLSCIAVCGPPKCQCIRNFKRDSNGQCIPIEDCPGICPINEQYSSCIEAVCGAQNCSQRGQPIACPSLAEGSCQQGCVCITGYLRNQDGTCVPEDQCEELSCGEYEERIECSSVCNTDACPDGLNEIEKPCILICGPPKCQCISNYKRDCNGTCIPIGDCPGICPINEQYSSCTEAVCEARNCSQRGQPIACPSLAEGSCQQGCVCITGYLRNKDGTCVPEDQCEELSCGEYEERIECSSVCNTDACPDGLNEIEKPCILICGPPKCQCISNYKRDCNGTCIPIGDCPGICPIYEQYSSCTEAVCEAQNCSQRGQPIACPSLAEGSCKQGCVCITGYLRNQDGTCVPEDQCESLISDVVKCIEEN